MKLLTVDEVAQKLRTTSATIRHKINSGEITATKNGKSWLIDESDLQTYINRNKNNK
jgi:excisionase family DNA binding protein